VLTTVWAVRVLLRHVPLYPLHPSLGLAGAMAATAVGQLCGPLASGTLASRIGLTDVLIAGAGIIALASLAAPRTAIDS
jgi:hypothetical protein